MKAALLHQLAEDWLVKTHPGSVIVHEMSVADWGGAMVDVCAITPTHIVGVEIKGEGDSPTRLALQGLAYGMVVKEMWLLPSSCLEARCLKHKPPGWGMLEIWEGRIRPRNRAVKHGTPIVSKDGRSTSYPLVRDDSRYEPARATTGTHLSPLRMCGALWRDELYDIARLVGCKARSRATVDELTEEIIATVPAPELHDHMIHALRQRKWTRRVLDTRKPGEAA